MHWFRITAVAGLMAITVAACGADREAVNDSASLSEDSDLAAHWLAEGVAGTPGTADPFFMAFYVSDSVFYGDVERWECIFRSVLRVLDTPATRNALSKIERMAGREPDNAPNLRWDAQRVLAGLPDADRLRIADAVISATTVCGDIRLGLFGSGGPIAVCAWDTAGDLGMRPEAIALSILDTPRTAPDFPPAWMDLLAGCYETVVEAEQAGAVLPWVAELEEAWSVSQRS